ncbi:MAG: Gfo/Idh/MocA family oxidoreductase [Kiritimatiellae bacterium]|nr:Gfo/Idh/MocA family oxidoreductase [Kiritimatiellia bacterium]
MKITRKAFLGATAPFLAGGCRSLFNIGYAAPHRPPASERINLAILGCGTQAYDNVTQFLQDPRVQITVTCDPVLEAPGYSYRAHMPGGRQVFKRKVDEKYGNTSCRMTADWREVIDDPTIDAVAVITPDHWHAILSIEAMKRGKHVYCQKPMSLGIAEGQAMVRAAKRSGVTFQVGNQGRSYSSQRVAAELALNGYLGKVKRVEVELPNGSGGKWGHGVDTTRRSIPSYFTPETWSIWQGPAQHWENDVFIPGIHEPMCWRWNSRYGGGMITDFGAHMFDLVHRGLGMDRSGPLAIENFTAGRWQQDRGIFTWAGEFSFDLIYPGDVCVHVFNHDDKSSNKSGKGTSFIGEKGTVTVLGNTLVRPDYLKKWNEKRDLKDSEIHLYKPKDGHSHEMDFIDGIYENRETCSPCEVGHRTISAAHIANICERLGAKSLKWDPKAERFIDNDAANALVDVPYFNGFSLDA